MYDNVRRWMFTTYPCTRRALLPIAAPLLILLAACATPQIAPLRFDAPPWQDGEVSEYTVTDINGQYAGTARIDISRTDDQFWNIRREISTPDIQEIISVDVEEPGYRPQMSTLVRIDDEGAEQVVTTYGRGQVDLELTSKQNITTYQRVNIPSDARDQRTLAVIVRSLPLSQGYATRINSFLPIVPLLERVVISVTGQDEVTVPAGAFTTWQVTFDTGDSESQVWIGVDAPYPLVRYIDGRSGGIYELASFQPSKS